MISQYSASVPFPVYDQKVWWSDDWDALTYGVDFDFSRPFFEQFEKLRNRVPQMSLFVISGTLENSDYTNCTGYLKNCYLVGEADYNEDSYFSNRLFHNKNLIDCSTVHDSELCYECIDCSTCQRLKFSQECNNCHDSWFLNNCNSCSDCIACINQRQKKYMIFNKQYSKEEYEKIKNSFDVEKIMDFFKTQPHLNLHEEQNQNSFGDHLYNSKNARYCFDCDGLEDSNYCTRLVGPVKDCMDYTSWGSKAELVYQCASCGANAYYLKFCSNCTTNNSNMEYCYQCTGCDELFACTGLKRKKFCIFNKQYSESDYRALKEKIIEHMKKTGEYGEFFPISFSPHAYNDTIAMDEFPIDKENAISKGYKWHDPETRESIAPTPEVPLCESCKLNFKLMPQELAFYKENGIQIPTNCPLCRHKARQRKRSSVNLREVACTKCGKSIMTGIPKEQSENIYCKECYLSEVY